MKEIETQNKIEIKETAEVRKQRQFLKSHRPKPGQKMWEINVEIQQIEQATYAESQVEMRELHMPQMMFPKIVPVKVSNLVRNPNCLYYPALNKENALKKFNKDKKAYGIQ